VDALDDVKAKEKAMFLNRWALDLIEIVKEKDRPSFAKRICSPVVWFLWGQGLIKISRNYLLPKRSSGESAQSFGHHKALYFHCLDVAATKFEKCSRLVVQLSRQSRQSRPDQAAQQKNVLEKMNGECMAALGHILLSKAREVEDETLRSHLFQESITQLRRAHWLDPSTGAIYNLACVLSITNRPLQCKSYLDMAARNGALPPLIHVYNDPDLDSVRSYPWFADFLQHVPNEKPSADQAWMYSLDIGMTLLESTYAMPEPSVQAALKPHATLHIPKTPDQQFMAISPTTATSNAAKASSSQHAHVLPSNQLLHQHTQQQNQTAQQAQAKNAGKDKYDGLTESMYFDEGLNKLQASLARDGFSRSTIVSMLKDVHKQKKADKAQHERFEAAHARLMMRLEAAGMKQKSVIPGDGNCQFHSISDQLFDGLEQSAWVRQEIVSWLRTHGDWELPENGARLRDFALEEWDSYCAHMAKPGIWGDHLTLTAASQRFGVRIVLFSSIEDNHYVTEYVPTIITSPKVLYLCHYAEYHYGSVCRKEQEEIQQDEQAAKLAESIAPSSSSSPAVSSSPTSTAATATSPSLNH